MEYVVAMNIASLRVSNGNGNLSVVDELRMRVVISFCHQTFWWGGTNVKYILITFSENFWRWKQKTRQTQTVSDVSVLLFVAEYGFNISWPMECKQYSLFEVLEATPVGKCCFVNFCTAKGWKHFLSFSQPWLDVGIAFVLLRAKTILN